MRKEKLLILLTRFIRKENLDKRGCKITEIVERHKIKADPIFGDQFIIGMNCVVFLFSSIHELNNFFTVIRHGRHVQDTSSKRGNKCKANDEPNSF